MKNSFWRPMFSKFCKCLYLFILIGLTTNLAEARYLSQYATCKVPGYRLIDLGPSRHSERVLSRQCWPLSLAPKTNNKSQVVGNRGEQAFIWQENLGFFHFFKCGLCTNFVDIANNGTILGRVHDIDGSSEWFIWSENQCKRDTLPTYLGTECLYGEDLFLRSINDHGQIVGARRMDGDNYRAIFWDHKKRMMEIKPGILLDVNNKNNMLGIESSLYREQPFLWHIRGGKSIIGDDPCTGKPSCLIKFGFPVISADNTVYGTYTAQKKGIPYVYAYHWNCEDQFFGTLNLCNMKITAVNRCHTLVGKQGCHAVISINHSPPKRLIKQVKNNAVGWNLIEATDINDLGQIVGYGTRWGKIHLFMLDPIP